VPAKNVLAQPGAKNAPALKGFASIWFLSRPLSKSKKGGKGEPEIMKNKTKKALKLSFNNSRLWDRGSIDLSLLLLWVAVGTTGLFVWLVLLDFLRTTFLTF
jgi:hypothetical protein